MPGDVSDKIASRRACFAKLALAALPLLVSCTNTEKAPDLPARVAGAPMATPSLVPFPAHLTMQSGRFVISTATPLVFDRADADSARIAASFTDLLYRTRGLRLASRSGGRGAITLSHLADPDATGKEGYRLDVTPAGVTISASKPAGLFYGAITLWQLLSQTPGTVASVAVPALQIDDAPRFAWRGLMLDSVRHFQTVDFIKTLIDAMAREKLNVLQWHLTDDQGWRLEIKKYPRLTQIGGWRVPAGAAEQLDIDPATERPRLYGGFYSQDQVRDLVAYAAARNITIVPEIEMPGHAMAAIVAYPRLGSLTEAPTATSGDWGIFPYLYNVNDETFAFLEDVLSETMALFPSAYIHVGGDEAVKDQWKVSPSVQARMHALGVADEEALQGWFIQRIEKFLEAHGRRMIGWDEILQGGVGPDATIMSWRGIAGGVTAAKAGHDVVLSPAPSLYFDFRQAEGRDEPSGRNPIVRLADVYAFDPAPAELTADERRHIIGVQANVWSEYIREQENVGYAVFPRAAALAELAWSPASAHDRASFLARMPAELDRYAALGLPHSTHITMETVTPISDRSRDSHELKPCNAGGVVSMEGPAPLKGKRPVFLHNPANPCWIFEKADLSGISHIQVMAGSLPYNHPASSAAQKIVLRPQATANGELGVHLDGCEGATLAALPMPKPEPNSALASVQGALTPQTGVHDLCLMFTRAAPEPYWALQTVTLAPD
ncbi:MAG TPA: family 20 glycosylhydrolase [Rhizomicrobium sp.]|nr:family 20 glycosylhydrolase [Rhizomicrobium sp.]